MSAPDLSDPIRDALLANPLVTGQLPAYLGSFPIFSRRPSPANAPYPLIMVSQDISLTDGDGINDFRPRVLRDVATYHTNEIRSNEELTYTIALAVWRMFHRNRAALTVPGWGVTDIQASVPIVVDAGESKVTGSIVQLQIFVAKAG